MSMDNARSRSHSNKAARLVVNAFNNMKKSIRLSLFQSRFGGCSQSPHCQLPFKFLVKPSTIVVDNFHSECFGSSGYSLSDTTTANNSEPALGEIGPEHHHCLEALELSFQHVMMCWNDIPASIMFLVTVSLTMAVMVPPGKGKQERHRHIGCCVRQHSWSVRHRYTMGGSRYHI